LKCLDTDLLIAILRGKQEAHGLVVEIELEPKAATTSINAFEVFYGAFKSQMKSQNLKETEKLLENLEILPLMLSSARKAAQISVQLAEKGEPIDFRDAMVAGVAIVNDLTLVSRNKAHFGRVKELKYQTW
jgi:tRNA(fMet)-specific endonuclease VapC